MKSTLVFTRIVQLIVVMLALVAALVLGFGLVPLARAQTDIYVRPLGHDSSCNGTADVDYSIVDAPNCAVRTIQRGIDLADPGSEVFVETGVYIEDLIIDTRITLSGAGQSNTYIYPETSGPVCNVDPPTSLCYDSGLGVYSATTMILIRAHSVTIHDLTLDGDNFGLISGVEVNGADIDARNGIVGDYVTMAPNNLTVYDVTVRNVYMRGIYATGNAHVTGVDFHDNEVRNAAGVGANSAGIIFYNATGSMVNNTVEDAMHGLSCTENSTCLIRGNDVTDAVRAGIYVADVDQSLVGSTSATLRDNEIYDTRDNGVALRSRTNFALTVVLDGNLIDNTSNSGVNITGPGALDVTLGDSMAAANTFRNTGGYLVQLSDAADDDVAAHFNDWDVTDLDDIEAAIVHQVDNAALGEVLYYGIDADAAPTTVVADGSDSATIIATLTGLYAPQDNVVSFATSLGTVSPATDTTAPDTANTTLTSTTSGDANITASAGYRNATTNVTFVHPVPDHFSFAPIGNQVVDNDFTVTIAAEDSSNQVLTGYDSYALLSDTSGTVTPNTTGSFTDGVWSGSIRITQPYTGNVLTATYPFDSQITGTSNAFTVFDGFFIYLPLIKKNISTP
jgi:hypothetical protein